MPRPPDGPGGGRHGGMSALAARRRSRAAMRSRAPIRSRPAAHAAERTAEHPETPPLRLVAFVALAAFAAAHWAGLFGDPPAARLAGAVAVAEATGAALLLLGGLRLPRAGVHLAALAVSAAGLALALVVCGLPARLLAPGAWGELAGELDRGLSGIRTVEWPYEGKEEQVRLVILLGAPLMLVAAAALAFWPVSRRGGALRALALVSLLVLYGLAVTEHDPGEPLRRGFALLVLLGVWLWLPRLRGRQALAGAAVVLGVGVLTLPAAARLDAETALLDYRSWNWFGGKDIVFDWDHTYGPLDWPRKGTTLLNVEADRPQYWKAETLDSFDGLRWRRSGVNDRTAPFGELPPDPDVRWSERIRVTVRSLRTDFVVGTGTPLRVSGAGDSVSGSADGTVRRLDEPLRRGDTYTVRSYSPDPSPRRMRAARGAYDAELAQYTRIELPPRGEPAPPPRRPDGRTSLPWELDRAVTLDRDVTVPLRGREPDLVTDFTLDASPYAKTFRLARRLAAGAPTAYDVADRIEAHLRTNYTYSERPPSREYPLESFLFEDKIGYCQQFSGAMALMLRMTGIPARVVSGFSPGSYDSDSREFRVRDLDAHSWVEVYFSGLGWVTFDPTPQAAPADRAGQGPEAKRLDIPTGGETRSSPGASPLSDPAGDPDAASPDGAGSEQDGLPAPALLLAVVLLVGGGIFVARRRRHDPALAEGAELRELERALPRLGWSLAPGMTLLELERRMRRLAGPAAARYVALLREGRFSPRAISPPGRAERRALRRELTAAGGLRGRLRGFLALRPGGPRARA